VRIDGRTGTVELAGAVLQLCIANVPKGFTVFLYVPYRRLNQTEDIDLNETHSMLWRATSLFTMSCVYVAYNKAINLYIKWAYL
jgi:hypothetical protein